MEEKGKRRVVWLSNELDDKAEATRKRFGLSRSSFLRFAVVEMVKEMEQVES